jgi:hypothetical protein
MRHTRPFSSAACGPCTCRYVPFGETRVHTALSLMRSTEMASLGFHEQFKGLGSKPNQKQLDAVVGAEMYVQIP